MAKTHTSTAVKRRYNKKVYAQISLQIPKEAAKQFRGKCKAENVRQRQVLIKAIDKFLDE